jgi:uncharacterized protein YciI
MPHFLCKLTPPRRTFAADMTATERDTMLAHQDYWRPRLDAGTVIAMGPVADPEGVWGVAIIDAPSLAELQNWQAEDPAILSDGGFGYENFPMPAIRTAPIQPLAPVSSVTP